MKFQTLVLEGDREKEKREEHQPVYTKEEYLRRKQRQSRPPLRSRSFYLCRMIEEELRGTEIDGSGKITICAHQTRALGREKYICDGHFQVSIYYLEPEEIRAMEEADGNTGAAVIFGILKKALLDIARRSHCAGETVGRIEEALERIAGSHFVREEQISKLSRRSKTTGLTACVYRILSAGAGEGWYLTLTDRKGAVLRREILDGDVHYVDRLGSRLYAKAEWRGEDFVILERFGREVVRVSASS